MMRVLIESADRVRLGKMFTIREGESEGLEDKKEERKAARSQGKNLEESANRALMSQGRGKGCCGKG